MSCWLKFNPCTCTVALLYRIILWRNSVNQDITIYVVVMNKINILSVSLSFIIFSRNHNHFLLTQIRVPFSSSIVFFSKTFTILLSIQDIPHYLCKKIYAYEKTIHFLSAKRVAQFISFLREGTILAAVYIH